MSALLPLRVAPGGRSFETTDGEPFLFIGQNDALSWPGLSGLFRRRDVAGVNTYLHSLKSSGVTILRMMLEYAQDDSHFFERPAGKFNPTMVKFWDDLFELCARHGLRLLLAPWDNFWMARRWHKHPYNVLNGGPAHSPAAFFQDDSVVDATIRRLLFVVERWGGSGVLAAWDLFNEIHPYWGGTPGEQMEVIGRISAAVRQAELRCWGFTRLQTVSIFGPEPEPHYEELIFRHPSLDFATTHIYQGAIDFPKETVEPAVTMGKWVRHALERIPAGRPFVDTEHGPIHMFNDHHKIMPEEMDDEYERHLMWAHLASGGAGSGMRWPARHPHVLTEGMKAALASLAAFAKGVNWSQFALVNVSAEVEVGVAGVHAFACRDSTQAVIWLLRGHEGKKQGVGVLPTREPLHDVSLTLHGMDAGTYRVRQWNTREGQSPGTLCAEVEGDGTLRVTVPRLRNDLALAISREETQGKQA